MNLEEAKEMLPENREHPRHYSNKELEEALRWALERLCMCPEPVRFKIVSPEPPEVKS